LVDEALRVQHPDRLLQLADQRRHSLVSGSARGGVPAGRAPRNWNGRRFGSYKTNDATAWALPA
jgi:hypothetical protein